MLDDLLDFKKTSQLRNTYKRAVTMKEFKQKESKYLQGFFAPLLHSTFQPFLGSVITIITRV